MCWFAKDTFHNRCMVYTAGGTGSAAKPETGLQVQGSNAPTETKETSEATIRQYLLQTLFNNQNQAPLQFRAWLAYSQLHTQYATSPKLLIWADVGTIFSGSKGMLAKTPTTCTQVHAEYTCLTVSLLLVPCKQFGQTIPMGTPVQQD